MEEKKMSKKLISFNQYLVGKKAIKLEGVQAVPANGELVHVTTQGTHVVGRVCIEADLTGSQKLYLFDEKEAPDGKVKIYGAIWNKFVLENAEKSLKQGTCDVLLTDVRLNDRGYHIGTIQFIENSESVQYKPWQVKYVKTIKESDDGLAIVHTSLKFRRPKRKEEDGTYVEDETIPYITVQTFEESGMEYGNIQAMLSLHKKTATSIFGADDERVKGAENDFVTYFPSLTCYGRILKQVQSLEKYMDRVFEADIILKKSKDNKYYNGQILSLAFAPNKTNEEEKEEETTEETKADPSSAEDGFPDLSEEVPFEETETEETSYDGEEELMDEFPEGLD